MNSSKNLKLKLILAGPNLLNSNQINVLELFYNKREKLIKFTIDKLWLYRPKIEKTKKEIIQAVQSWSTRVKTKRQLIIISLKLINLNNLALII